MKPITDETLHKDRQGFPNTERVSPLNIAKLNRNTQELQEVQQDAPAGASNSNATDLRKKKDPAVDHQEEDEQLDEALKHTFPASDPAQQP